MAVAAVHATPAVDDDVRAEFSHHADHILHYRVAPDSFRFLGSFRKAEILGAGEIEFHAVAARGGKKFLRADEAELRSLFGAERVLAALTAGDGEKRDIGVQSAGQISENRSGFVVRMRGDIEDARGDARGVNGLDGFSKPGAGARCGGKLRMAGEREKRGEQNRGCQADASQKASKHYAVYAYRMRPER